MKSNGPKGPNASQVRRKITDLDAGYGLSRDKPRDLFKQRADGRVFKVVSVTNSVRGNVLYLAAAEEKR